MYKKTILLFLLIITLSTSCKKFLDGSPSPSLIIPSKLTDLQALLDNSLDMNLMFPVMPELSADDYYMEDNDYSAMSQQNRSAYIWGDGIYFQQYPNDWSILYDIVNTANIVLDYLPKIERNSNNAESWDEKMQSSFKAMRAMIVP